MSHQITLAYWEGVRGRVQPIRLILEYLNIEYDEQKYQAQNWQEWFEEDKPILNNPFPNLPYVIDNKTSEVICESEAIWLFLCQKAGKLDLIGVEMKDRITIARVKGVVFDIMQAYLSVAYSSQYNDEYRKTNFQQRVIPKLAQLNNYLEDKEFLNEGKLCIVDFYLYEGLEVLQKMEPKILEQFAFLKKFQNSFSKLESIQKLMASDRYPQKELFFGPQAYFKE